MTTPFPARSLLFALLALAGCGRPAPTAVPMAWNWAAFPQEDRLLVAEMPARAAPARVELIPAPAAGVLHLVPGLNPHEPIAAGTVWARIEPADTTEQDTAGRLEAEIERRRQRYAALERPALLAQAERDLHAAEETRAAAEFAEKNPGLFQGDRPLLDPALRPGLSSDQLADFVRSLKEKRDQLARSEAAAEPADLLALRTERERLQEAAAKYRQRLQLTAPFSGLLTLADPTDGRSVAAGAPLALLADPGVLRLRVRATPLSLAGLPPASLELEAALPGGSLVKARNSGSSFESGEVIVSVLWFDTAVEHGLVSPLGAAGTELPARIYLRLPTSACIVPKLELAHYDRQNALAGGWRDAVAKLFPGATFVAEGRTAVAILPPAP